MKELTIEEKVKRYDEAIKKAESLYKAAEPMSGCNVILETIFPELAENEDERIRKAIVNAIHNYAYRLEEKIPTEWLVWLEKQKEHYDFRQSIQVGDHVTKNDAGILVNLSQLERAAKSKENKGNIGGISPTWSEEDEINVYNIIHFLEEPSMLENNEPCKKIVIDWLKSLSHQTRWKPSSEQISLLQAIINEPNNAASESCQIVLKDILEQLKKLKKK